jgi:hypothetical protein
MSFYPTGKSKRFNLRRLEMQDPKLEVVGTFKYEKRLKIFVAIYLSMILLVIAGVLVKVDMATELQQVLVVILGLITIATLDAFRKVLENTSSSVASRFNRIVVQEGGFYVNGGYYVNGNINQGGERKQTLAEAAEEIQQLLIQLEKSNPTATDAEKVAYVNDETPPALKSRVASAVKAGSASAVETILDNSAYGNVVRAIFKAWLSSEEPGSRSITTPVQRTDSDS